MPMTGESFVSRLQNALVETILLTDTQAGPRTLDQLWSSVKGVAFTSEVDEALVRSAAERLASDGHLEKEGESFVITDDGREDVQKMEPALSEVVARLSEGVTSTTRNPPRAGGGR